MWSDSASYGQQSTASQRSAFSDSSVSALFSGSYRGLASFAAKALGSCFGPARRSRSMLKGVVGGDASETSQATSVTSNRSGRSHGMRNPRRRFSGLINDSSRDKPEPGSMKFTLSDINMATDNFSPSHKIGQGGFGTVYKGVLDGKVVAIKRGKKSIYNKHVDSEFQREVSTLACIEHFNLVRFMGYLVSGEERIIVVEYVPNGTLREHLDGARGSPLDLATRLDIAVDVAHAVTYLHMYADRPIIHRDIKSSNILLTDSLRAKVTDFGFARLGSLEDGMTHISTQIKGTAGYVDPDYLQTNQLSEKSDVYSFGVLLVELVSGRRPIETKREVKERITARWAVKKFVDGNAIQILDPNLPQNAPIHLALDQILELACQCLAPTKHSRPSMRRCAEILWSVRKEYRGLLSSDHSDHRSSTKLSSRKWSHDIIEHA